MPFSRNRDPEADDAPRAIEGPVIEGRVARRGEPVPGRQVPAPDEYPVVPRKRRRKPPPPPPQGRGCLGTCALFGGLSLLIMTLVTAFVVVIVTVGFADFMGDPIDNILGIFGYEDDATPMVVDSKTIVLGIQQMALLQTVSSDIQITKTVVDTKPAPDAELRMSYIGYVTAGIDLSLVTENDVVTNPDGSLTITLPPAQITGCFLRSPDIIDSSCTEIPFGVQDCDDILERLQETAYARSLEELLETANEQDLVSLANQNAETSIFELLRTLGYDRIEFVPNTQQLPPAESCLS